MTESRSNVGLVLTAEKWDPWEGRGTRNLVTVKGLLFIWGGMEVT